MPAVTSGGRARVTPAADRMRMFDPFDSRPRPMISCASRRLSIRYKPLAYSTPAMVASRSSISALSQNRFGQGEHDGQDDADDCEKNADVEHQRCSDVEHR